jgi:CRP-like cAMP-binding protein
MEALAMAASASSRGLLAYQLLKLAERAGHGRILEVPIGQADLADIVGTAREVGARALRSFRDSGIVRTAHTRILITDPVRLSAIAGLPSRA